jgi:site-specific DNA recombinase
MQSTEGVTLQNQSQRIADWCKANGHELVKVYEDAGLSGSKVANREGLKQALEAVKAARGILVVYSLSRLSRNIVHASQITEALDKAGASLASISEKVDLTNASGRLYFNLLLCFAQGERATLQERVKSAMQFKARQGKRVGTVPFGWVCKDGENLTPCATEQKTLALILDLSAQGRSLKAIVEALKAKGCQTKNGGAWKRETVRQIVKRNQALKVAA